MVFIVDLDLVCSFCLDRVLPMWAVSTLKRDDFAYQEVINRDRVKFSKMAEFLASEKCVTVKKVETIVYVF